MARVESSLTPKSPASAAVATRAGRVSASARARAISSFIRLDAAGAAAGQINAAARHAARGSARRGWNFIGRPPDGRGFYSPGADAESGGEAEPPMSVARE